MKSLTLVFVCSVLLSSCSSELRASFCGDSLVSLDESLWGTYEVVMPTQSTTFSNTLILTTTRIQLKPNMVLVSANNEMIPEFGAACRINGRFFFERQNENGTYSITEATKFSQGIVLSMMSIDVDAVKEAGFSLHYLPSEDRLASEGTNGPMNGSVSGGKFILDNRKLTPEQVLSVTKPISMQFVLRSVSEKEPFAAQKKVQILTATASQ